LPLAAHDPAQRLDLLFDRDQIEHAMRELSEELDAGVAELFHIQEFAQYRLSLRTPIVSEAFLEEFVERGSELGREPLIELDELAFQTLRILCEHPADRRSDVLPEFCVRFMLRIHVRAICGLDDSDNDHRVCSHPLYFIQLLTQVSFC